MEIEKPIDWQKRRLEIIENIRKEKETMEKTVRKAMRLSKGWGLMIECKNFLRENSNNWQDMQNKIEEREKKERFEMVRYKKEKLKEKEAIKKTNKKINDMLETIPKVEAERIEMEIRNREKIELKEIKENLWKRWRGKKRISGNKTKIPKEADKLQEKLDEIE